MLMPPPLAFSAYTDNLGATSLNSTPGTLVKSSSLANTYGAPVTVLNALTHNSHFLSISLGYDGSTCSTDILCALVNILVDPAGGTSWSTKITSLAHDILGAPDGSKMSGCSYIFPIYIPAGTSIGAESAFTTTTTAGLQVRVLARAVGGPNNPGSWWFGQTVETLGDNTVATLGTSVAVSSGEWSAWTNVGGLTSNRYGHIQLGALGSTYSTAVTQQKTAIQIGYNNTRLPGSPTWIFGQDTKAGILPTPVFLPCDIPAGTQMQARTFSTNLSPCPMNLIMYGVI